MAEKDPSRDLAEFQHWRDAGLAERGFARWAELRGAAPRLFHSDADKPGNPDAKWWYLLSYEDVRDAYMHPETYSSAHWQAVEEASVRLIPVGLDPPEHGKYRRALNAPFAPREINKLEDEIREYCVSLIDAFVDRGTCEFRTEFALRFPTAVFVKMIGLPIENLDHYIKLIHDWHQTSPDEDLDGSRVAAAQYAVMQEFAVLAAERREKPQDDLMSYLLGIEIDGAPMNEGDLLATCLILLSAGLDTVVAQLSHIFTHLAKDAPLRARIRNQPESIPKIIDEMMRFYSIATSARTLTHDTEVGGCPMHAGDRILMPLAAANRDPAVFANPEQFDPDRPGNVRQLGFGTGVHSCLGVHLARMEMRIALEEWHKRIPDYGIREGTQPELLLTDMIVGVKRLELSWNAALA